MACALVYYKFFFLYGITGPVNFVGPDWTATAGSYMYSRVVTQPMLWVLFQEFFGQPVVKNSAHVLRYILILMWYTSSGDTEPLEAKDAWEPPPHLVDHQVLPQEDCSPELIRRWNIWYVFPESALIQNICCCPIHISSNKGPWDLICSLTFRLNTALSTLLGDCAKTTIIDNVFWEWILHSNGILMESWNMVSPCIINSLSECVQYYLNITFGSD